MKLSVSNIAWGAEETDAAYALLEARSVTGLEIAPPLFLADEEDPFDAPPAACAAALERAGRHGLALTSMQSLLFGVKGAALFGSEAERETLSAAMARVTKLAGRLGVPNLVFGAPKNRVIPEGWNPAEARAVWLPAFLAMGAAAADAGTVLALEQNPAEYGTNFMTRFGEALDAARAADHPGVRINLDLGALIMTGEIDGVAALLPEALPLVSHVHLSAPNLDPLTTVAVEVRHFVAALSRAGWTGWVSIEMKRDFAALPAAIGLVREAIEAA